MHPDHYNQLVRELSKPNAPRIPKRTGARICSYDYVVDHIVPVSVGYLLDIPPELMGSKDNLQAITHWENSSKGARLTPEGERLLTQWGYDVHDCLIKLHVEPPHRDIELTLAKRLIIDLMALGFRRGQAYNMVYKTKVQSVVVLISLMKSMYDRGVEIFVPE